MGKHSQGWYSTTEVLNYFDPRLNRARALYQRFLAEGLENASKPHLTGGGLVRSHGGWESLGQLRKEHIFCIGGLGESEFVEKALEQDELLIERKLRLKQAGWDVEKLVEKVCCNCDVDKKHLLFKARATKLSQAKSLIYY